MPSENVKPRKINENSLANLKPFDGSTPGPGRPPLSPEVKAERKELRKLLENISPKSISRLESALESKDERNAIRAAEIVLSHTVAKLQEGVNGNESKLPLLLAMFREVTGREFSLSILESSNTGNSRGAGQ